ncbi:MAG: 16S rRNA (adenine(1518)-N(6)/adenine(1519)-N(6))-dimethyltransferase RsmA [Gammaproteobacteria bacterium]|nr:16S rRNA (adenine(1518)-N(6)/adenine(1519)-N(6))-dimethyltransferase RsmA [Gammaproteobacteria bacterium]
MPKQPTTVSSGEFARPRKSLGQNFLQDPNIIRKIADSLVITPADTVLEIGPGRGALTEQLLARCTDLHVVEFDRELIAYWQRRAEQLDNLTVHGADILKFDLSPLLSGSNQPLKVIGNLPYNISSPVLFHLLPFADQIHSQIVMLQKEVVDRMVAGPGNKQYGRLSVMLQQRYRIERLFDVPPGAFFPPPKVDSAIVQLTPLVPQPFPVQDHAVFEAVVKQAFSQRRKTLRNTLKGTLSAAQIEACGIDPAVRAETLSVEDFTRLAEAVTKAAG